ncbi:T9SS type A sorting domain-containing protein [Flavobacteriaceae bacterium SZ-1-7]|uniref:T9SS type A sorting domain-containing protein n=1 Tax=Tamlana sedimenti TaxID=3134126 RepID=UPI003129FECD
MKKFNFIIVALLTCFVVKAQISAAEYFIDDDPGVGSGMPLAISGDDIDADLSISTTGLSEGIHKLYVRVLSNSGEWSLYDKSVFFINTNQNNTASIASAEYFMDTDPGVGSGMPLSVSGNTVDTDFIIPTTGLSSGIHKLYVRLLNTDGTFSLYDKNVFYINPDNTNSANIASAEYFIDIDPGIGSGMPLAVSGDVIDADFSIPTTGLSDGVHKLYIRVENENGTFSLYDKNVFYINPNHSNSANIASAEYFIDTDPGVGSGMPLNISGSLIDADFEIPTTGLSNGIHKLYFRVINEDGSWSLYDKNVFYVSPDNSNTSLITAAEYFFDIDPGIGNGTTIDLNDAEILDENLSLDVPANLSAGNHFLYMRVQNTDGKWSLYALGELVGPLSVSDEEKVYFKFYPNPVKDILYLDVENQKILDFKVINLRGEVVLENLQETNQIDMSSLSSGMYLFHLETEKGRVSKKFVKQ